MMSLKLEQRIVDCEKLLTESNGDAAWGYLGELIGLLNARAGRPEHAALTSFETEHDPREIIRPRCEQGYKDGIMLLRLESVEGKGG